MYARECLLLCRTESAPVKRLIKQKDTKNKQMQFLSEDISYHDDDDDIVEIGVPLIVDRPPVLEDDWNLDQVQSILQQCLIIPPLAKIVLSYNVLHVEFPLDAAATRMDNTSVKTWDYNGHFTMDCWHTQTKFINLLSKLQNDVSTYLVEHQCIGPCRQNRHCGLMTSGTFCNDKYGGVQWDSRFLGHYLCEHNAVPSLEFYNFVMKFGDNHQSMP
jgi:hypothetical protein